MDKRQIRIGSPCTLDWKSMKPTDGGRFCGDCKKVVRDLSRLSEAEAKELLRQPEATDLCVRFIHDRDGKIVFAEPRTLLPAALLSRAKRAAMIAATVAVPMAVGACSLPASALSDLTDDSSDNSNADAGYVENMGGAPAMMDDAGDTDAADAAPTDDDASPDASPTADDAGTEIDAGPDGSPI